MKGKLERNCPNCGDTNRFKVDELDNLLCVGCGCVIGTADIEMKLNYYQNPIEDKGILK